MTVTEAPGKVTTPGVHQLTDEEYHADPVEGGSLSSTGARQLLPPSCPALFRHQQLHGQPHKRVWDFGSAAHAHVLGVGPELVVIEAANYRTKAAQEARNEAHEAGAIPLLEPEHDQVLAMAAALRRHPVARALFDPDRGGQPEQSLIWQDAQTGVMRRARLDWLPAIVPNQRVIVGDYKTCVSAEPDALSKAAHNYGWHQQADWYLAGIKALFGLTDDDVAFVFIAQEKTPPYLVTPVELDHDAMRIGQIRNRRALSIYRHCVDNDEWPSYVDGVHLLSLPPWAAIEEGEHLT